MIDKNEAPEGYEAVEYGDDYCNPCALYNTNHCQAALCMGSRRTDGHSVTFKKIEIKEEINDMSEVKVGDVYLMTDADTITVSKIYNGRAAGWYIGTLNALQSASYPLDLFNRMKLIERDGKRIREFEENCYYMVNGEEIHQYINGKLYSCGLAIGYPVSIYTHVGEKINLGELK